MTNSKAMMAMFDAFDNANQGLAIWDEGDNLIGFNSVSYTHLTLPTIYSV